MNLGKTDNKKAVESMFEVGAHYGYAKSRRHPSTKKYIFETTLFNTLYFVVKYERISEKSIFY